jgi:RNA polymerase sigma-70 factor, ECF subfamily
VAGPLPLSRAFVDALRPPTEGLFPSVELEESLHALWVAGQAAWPQAGLDGADFARDLAARIGAAEAGPSLSRLHGTDLYLACACARGLPAAVALFETHYMSRVPAFVGRLDPAGTLTDEVAQELRIQLLLPAAGGEARIGDYSGRGELAAWLRVVALRAALKLRRAQRRLGVGVELPPTDLGRGPDPERDYLRLRYRADYEAAFRAALGSLESTERLLLKLHYVDGLNIDRIGAIYRLHRSTVARQLASHRRKLLDLTRGRLRERLNLSDSEFDSILALVRSQMVMSLRGALS